MVQINSKYLEGTTTPQAPANIAVIGVGGGGCNSVVRMTKEKAVPGVKYICANTDVKSLARVGETVAVFQIGERLTRGLGAGGDPKVGAEAAESARAAFKKVLDSPDLVFITAGMGGGTGTGAAPIIAEIARESGALVIGVVTTPFSFEGIRRFDTALSGISSFKPKVDNLIIIHNDRLLQLLKKEVPMEEALRLADEAVMLGVLSIAELVNLPGEINVDMADVKTIMKLPGHALMAIGQGAGPGGALEAAKQAVNNPLLDVSIEGAQGVLFNVNGGPSLTLGDVNETGSFIAQKVDPRAIIFFGMVNSEEMGDKARITVIATGIPDKNGSHPSSAHYSYSRNEDGAEDLSLPPFMRRPRRL